MARRTGIPALDRMGIVPKRGTVPNRSIFAPGSNRGGERPLLHQLIGEQTLSFYARALAVTTTLCDEAAWFGIASWRIPDDIGGEAALVGYRIELSAPDVTGADPELFNAGYADLIPWGYKNGGGGAVVVGLNLPSRVGVLQNGPAVPFAAENAGSGTIRDQKSNTWKVFHFNQGDSGVDGTPAVHRVAQVTPLARLLTGGNTLDVAVVIEKQWASNVTGTFGLKVFGELSLATALTPGTFLD